MLFYRLEHYHLKSSETNNINAGAYVYNEPNISKIATDYSYTSTIHPLPHNDNIKGWSDLKNYRDYFFGFESLEYLDSWFFSQEGMRDLDNKLLARIGVYQIHPRYVLKGDHQSVALGHELKLFTTLKCYRFNRDLSVIENYQKESTDKRVCT